MCVICFDRRVIEFCVGGEFFGVRVGAVFELWE